MHKQLTLISRQSPYGSVSAREALDVALASAAFDMQVHLVFLGDGVFQLCQNQQPDALGLKNLSSNLQALELFGVETVYVLDSDLSARGLDANSLCIPVQVLDTSALQALLATSGPTLSI